MNLTFYTSDGRTKQFPNDKFLRQAVTEWLGYPAVKFYTTKNGEGEINTFSPDDVVFALPYTPDKSLGPDIFKACGKGYVEEVNDLISRCANVNATDELMYTPLHFASFKGHDSVVDILLKNGADVNATNKNMNTPLYYASLKGHDSVVEMLLKNGAGVNATTINMYTPLHGASFKGYDSIVDILFKNGADVNATDNDNNTTCILYQSAAANK